MSFQHPFRLSSNTPSNAFQRPTVTPPIPPWALEGAPLEDGAPNAGRGGGALAWRNGAIFFGSVTGPDCLFN
jgi:hypothetical protein